MCPQCGKPQVGSLVDQGNPETAMYWHADGSPDACTPVSTGTFGDSTSWHPSTGVGRSRMVQDPALQLVTQIAELRGRQMIQERGPPHANDLRDMFLAGWTEGRADVGKFRDERDALAERNADLVHEVRTLRSELERARGDTDGLR